MRIFLLLLMMAVGMAGKAQKQVAVSEQTWAGFIQQMRISDKWGASLDVHFRTADDFVKGKNLSLGRIGANYFASEQIQLSTGYAYFHYYPGESNPGGARPEHRIWQQVLWQANQPRLRMQQRFRLEERWRQHLDNRGAPAEGFNFNWRARMQWQLLFPLGKKPFTPGSVALMLADEVMLNFGKEIVYNSFDQNRLITGIQWQLAKRDFLQIGYMNIFQQQASGNRYRLSHVARIFYTHNIDFRKGKTTASVIRQEAPL